MCYNGFVQKGWTQDFSLLLRNAFLGVSYCKYLFLCIKASPFPQGQGLYNRYKPQKEEAAVSKYLPGRGNQETRTLSKC